MENAIRQVDSRDRMRFICKDVPHLTGLARVGIDRQISLLLFPAQGQSSKFKVKTAIVKIFHLAIV